MLFGLEAGRPFADGMIMSLTVPWIQRPRSLGVYTLDCSSSAFYDIERGMLTADAFALFMSLATYALPSEARRTYILSSAWYDICVRVAKH